MLDDLCFNRKGREVGAKKRKAQRIKKVSWFDKLTTTLLNNFIRNSNPLKRENPVAQLLSNNINLKIHQLYKLFHTGVNFFLS